MKKTLIFILSAVTIFALYGCNGSMSSDKVQHAQQEKMLQEQAKELGMPAIVSQREKRLFKQIIEMRDQDGLVTYTYIVAENTGKFIFVCDSVGYGIPAATQYTNPNYIAYAQHETGVATLPQADPNGLFSPGSADGTWVMCKDPNKDKAIPVYIEPRVIVSPFKLNN